MDEDKTIMFELKIKEKMKSLFGWICLITTLFGYEYPLSN